MAAALPLHLLDDRDRSFIERVCVAHSEALVAGGMIPIEARLLEASARQRPALLVELLVLELEGALGRRALPTLAGLVAVHPSLEAAIRGVYQQLPDRLRLPERVGPYAVERFIADGGQARVVAGRDARGGLALVKYGVGPDAQRQLSREAATLQRLRHRRIRRLIAQGSDGAITYLALEYLVGRNLADLAEAAPLPPRTAARLAADVASAVAYVHAQGYLHRDIKPHNILVDARGRATLIDFALAIDENRGGSVRAPLQERGGTRAYMAPEHLAGDAQASGVRSDLYSLGAVLVFLLTGAHPSGEASPAEGLGRTPRGLRALCRRATAQAPADRYGSVNELLGEVRRYLRRDRAWRWARVAAPLLLMGALLGPPIWAAAAPAVVELVHGAAVPWYEQLAQREGLSFGRLAAETFELGVERGPRDPLAPRDTTRFSLTLATDLPAALRERLRAEVQVGEGPWRSVTWRPGETVTRVPLTLAETRGGAGVRLRLVAAFGVEGDFTEEPFSYSLSVPARAAEITEQLGASFDEVAAAEWLVWNGEGWEFSPALFPTRLAAVGGIQILDDITEGALLREELEDGKLLTASAVGGSVGGAEAARRLNDLIGAVASRHLRVTFTSDESHPQSLTRVFRAP